jgi:hypothetical protein
VHTVILRDVPSAALGWELCVVWVHVGIATVGAVCALRRHCGKYKTVDGMGVARLGEGVHTRPGCTGCVSLNK